jgi:hypothetical protein
MKKEDLQVGQRIWVEFGYSWHKAKIIAIGNGHVVFELTGFYSGITGELTDRNWTPRKSIFNPQPEEPITK